MGARASDPADYMFSEAYCKIGIRDIFLIFSRLGVFRGSSFFLFFSHLFLIFCVDMLLKMGARSSGGVVFLYLPMAGRLLDDKSVAAANERRTAKEHESGCRLSVVVRFFRFFCFGGTLFSSAFPYCIWSHITTFHDFEKTQKVGLPGMV